MKNFLLLLLLCSSLLAENIGLLVVATGKYDIFIDPLLDTADQYFCTGHNVTYFVFTEGNMRERPNAVKIYQERIGWPYDTMMRGHIYLKSRELLETQDYLYACDVDMLFAGEVGDEILGELVATQHPGFYGRRGSFEKNKQSLAYVAPNEGADYFCGGFYGGRTEAVLQMLETNARNIDDDLSRGVIAEWHDEAHWNRYCVDHPPTVILNPSYCHPECMPFLPFPKKLIALDKNHKEFQVPIEKPENGPSQGRKV